MLPADARIGRRTMTVMNIMKCLHPRVGTRMEAVEVIFERYMLVKKVVFTQYFVEFVDRVINHLLALSPSANNLP